MVACEPITHGMGPSNDLEFVTNLSLLRTGAAAVLLTNRCLQQCQTHVACQAIAQKPFERSSWDRTKRRIQEEPKHASSAMTDVLELQVTMTWCATGWTKYEAGEENSSPR